MARLSTIPRILFFNRSFYFDSTNGAAVASRALMEALHRGGHVAEVVSGTVVDAGPEAEPRQFLANFGIPREELAMGAGTAHGVSRLRVHCGGVPVTLLDRRLQTYRNPEVGESEALFRLADEAFDRFRPDVLISYGGDRITGEVFSRARRRGIATVFTLHNFQYRDAASFANVDAVIVPSRFAASYYRETLNLRCTALSNFIDFERVRAERRSTGYVTFVNPSIEKGVYVFARIAEELGKRRPDIPLLVVEARGTEATLADCGLDLRRFGNVSMMSHTADPRKFWSETRICLIPSLWLENQPLVAVEGLINGVPMIASDRGGLPETLGTAGVVLPVPDRLTPTTRLLPTAEEVAPWVETIVRLWDDEKLAQEHRRRAKSEAARWNPDSLESRYGRFLDDLLSQRESRRLRPT